MARKGGGGPTPVWQLAFFLDQLMKGVRVEVSTGRCEPTQQREGGGGRKAAAVGGKKKGGEKTMMKQGCWKTSLHPWASVKLDPDGHAVKNRATGVWERRGRNIEKDKRRESFMQN